jgi:hypothetical protein
MPELEKVSRLPESRVVSSGVVSLISIVDLDKANMPAKKDSGKQPGPKLLFIGQENISFGRENLRAIVSHARKTQTQQKHSQQRTAARREATYARSLVGWQQRSNPEQPTPTSAPKSTNKEAPKETKRTTRKLPTPTEMVLDLKVRQPGSGLRLDPFSALPFESTKQTMELIDFCRSPQPQVSSSRADKRNCRRACVLFPQDRLDHRCY